MTIPLSRFGITKEERDMLSNRLNPVVNKIFLENIAKKNGIGLGEIQELDYEGNDVYQFNCWKEKREQNAKRNLPINKDSGTTDYPYKTFEEAKKLDKKSTHILLGDDDDLKLQRECIRITKGKYIKRVNEDDEKIDVESDPFDGSGLHTEFNIPTMPILKRQESGLPRYLYEPNTSWDIGESDVPGFSSWCEGSEAYFADSEEKSEEKTDSYEKECDEKSEEEKGL